MGMGAFFRSVPGLAAMILPVALVACGKERGRTRQIPATPEYDLIGANASETAVPESEVVVVRLVSKPDWEWEEQLTELQFRITRKGETEPRFTGDLYKETRDGNYHCICCDAVIFDASTKYSSNFGWPTFSGPVNEDTVSTKPDDTAFRQRIAVQCRACEAHLGHIFDDGPEPEGTRYSINASALKFVPK
jgi:peptide-methionine (R)-S-oxide reductase